MIDQQKNFKPAAATETASQLLEIIRVLAAEIHPENSSASPSLNSSLERDLGLDSLAQMELLARIEKSFTVALSEKNLLTVDTVRDLLRSVMAAGGEKHEGIVDKIDAIKLAEVDNVPLHAENLVEVLEWHVKKHPNRPHIRFYNDQAPDGSITYLDLWKGAEAVASGLQHLGLEPGESVLIMLPTGAEYFFTFMGILLAGGIPVPVYPPGRLKQIEEHLLRHTAIAKNSLARMLVTVDEAKQFTKFMRTRVVNLHHVLTVPELQQEGSKTLSGFRRPALSAENIAFLQYTSGSTGMPKGVVLTHANLLANIRAMAKTVNVSSKDVFVSWLPLYHDMGLIGAWLGSLHYACQLIIMSPLAFVARPQRWLQAIHKYGGTLSAAPNFAYELCVRRIDAKEIEGIDLSSWRIAFNGAEAVNPETIRRFIGRFADYGFRPETMMPVYGLAESSVGLAFPNPGSTTRIDRIDRDVFMDTGQAIEVDETETGVLEFVSCGQPLPGHQVRIVDTADREVPERTEGSLQFIGPSTTTGYFRNPEKTSELFHGQWLDSGDKAYLAAGNLYITGRSKDMIIKAGRNIYPVELEDAVGKVDGIRDGCVAVFGSKSSDSATERLIILAETRKKEKDALDSIRSRINIIVTDLTGTPPDEVVLAPPNTVLKTSSGKIRRNASREIYERKLIGKPKRAVWLQLARFILMGLQPRIRSIMQGIKATLYASWCWFTYCLLTPPVGGLVFILPAETSRWAIMRFGVKLLAALTGTKITVRGNSNLLKKTESCIFISNHASYLDGYVLTAVLNRPVSFIAKAELQKKPVVSILLRRIGTLFVERFDLQESIKDVKKLTDRTAGNRSLFFFPEGTFMRMPGLLPFRMGAFETAARTDLPIVPIAIRGTRSILRADSWFPRSGAISVTFGDPITIARKPLKEQETWSKALELRDRSRKWLLLHCGEPNLGHERLQLDPSGPVLSHHL